jgi:replication fork clamp-binding protein CrfC
MKSPTLGRVIDKARAILSDQAEREEAAITAIRMRDAAKIHDLIALLPADQRDTAREAITGARAAIETEGVGDGR